MKEPVRLQGLPKDPRDRKSWLISIALHTVFVIAISSMAIVPILTMVREARSVKPERVMYLQTQEPKPKPPKAVRDSQPKPPPKQPSTTPARRDDSPPTPPATTAAPPVAVIPPTEIPVTIEPPRAAGGGDTTDRRIVGRDLLPGLSPGVKDPRLLGRGDGKAPDGPLTAGRSMADSVTHVWIRQFWDSVAHAQNMDPRRPPSWTFGSGDKKVGIDPAWIYFGKFKIPTALLALIPIKTQGNPTIFERQRALASMQREIEYQAMRSDNSKEFEDAVKELRARKEAEHRAAVAKKAKQ
jgi:hypothetical protein